MGFARGVVVVLCASCAPHHTERPVPMGDTSPPPAAITSPTPSAGMAEASARPSPSAAHAASDVPATATGERGSGVAATPTSDVDGAPPAGLTPEQARGQCVGRAELATARGPVSCYPYRCRNGRCLRSCSARSDCAGSDGPADFAENGWPLDCADHRCFPLPPDHVHP